MASKKALSRSNSSRFCLYAPGAADFLPIDSPRAMLARQG